MTDPMPVSTSNKPTENPPLRTDMHAVLLDRPEPPLEPSRSTRTELWMHRISVFLFVLISAVAGVLLIILPWTPEWTDNTLLLPYPALRAVVLHGFFRGVCSGLGLLDIWIGFWEALHYREHE
jgi:hypothetical protein